MIFPKNIKNLFSPKYLTVIGKRFFGLYARVFIFLIAIITASFCIKLWYDTIYHPQWDENQKNEYIKSKGEGMVFNEKGFDYGVAAAASRREESQKDLGNLTDVFRLRGSALPVNDKPAAPVTVPTTPTTLTTPTTPTVPTTPATPTVPPDSPTTATP